MAFRAGKVAAASGLAFIPAAAHAQAADTATFLEYILVGAFNIGCGFATILQVVEWIALYGSGTIVVGLIFSGIFGQVPWRKIGIYVAILSVVAMSGYLVGLIVPRGDELRSGSNPYAQQAPNCEALRNLVSDEVAGQTDIYAP